MLESESSALPFGDSPMFSTDAIIYEGVGKCKSFFKKIKKYVINLPLTEKYIINDKDR